MSCPIPISFQPLKALPSLTPLKCKTSSITPTHKLLCIAKPVQASTTNGNISRGPRSFKWLRLKSNMVVQLGLLATVAEPAWAVTGENNLQDLIWVLLQIGIVAGWYFLFMPPIILNWLRIRWFKRNLLEMYLQFMFVFMFFPGLLLWAPFMNFRQFPRDPALKYPWAEPENPSQVRGGFRKYPWATLEEYE